MDAHPWQLDLSATAANLRELKYAYIHLARLAGAKPKAIKQAANGASVPARTEVSAAYEHHARKIAKYEQALGFVPTIGGDAPCITPDTKLDGNTHLQEYALEWCTHLAEFEQAINRGIDQTELNARSLDQRDQLEKVSINLKESAARFVSTWAEITEMKNRVWPPAFNSPIVAFKKHNPDRICGVMIKLCERLGEEIDKTIEIVEQLRKEYVAQHKTMAAWAILYSAEYPELRDYKVLHLSRYIRYNHMPLQSKGCSALTPKNRDALIQGFKDFNDWNIAIDQSLDKLHGLREVVGNEIENIRRRLSASYRLATGRNKYY
ncbi:MAG: hypothetical protein ACRDTI_11575 [Mycobacterium sp.]